MKSKNNRGFSLVELLVVMAIISIVLSIGIPMATSLSSNKAKLSYSTSQFTKSITAARNAAMLRHGTVYFIFDPNSRNRYAFFSTRTVGDQPGKRTPTLLSDWMSLEDNIFFSEYLYKKGFNTNSVFENGLPQISIDTNKVFGSHTGVNSDYPYISFDSFGAVSHKQDVVIGLVMVSALITNDIVEIPEGNRRYIRVNSFMNSTVLGDFKIRRTGDKLEIMQEMEMFNTE